MADHRTQFGNAPATAMEQFAAIVAPGFVLEWTSKVWLVSADGRHEIYFPGLAQQPTNEGWLLATGFSFPDGDKEAATVLAQFPKVAILRTDARGNLIEARYGVVDAEARDVQITSIEIGTAANDGWPLLQVRYRGTYVSGDVSGVIDWAAVLGGDRLVAVERLPLQIKKVVAGSGPTVDGVRARRTSDGLVELRAATRSAVVRLPCSDPCLLQGPSLVAEWPTEP